MNFWIPAIALLTIPAIIISWPLFAGKSKERMTGMFVLLIMPLAGLSLYQQIGNPGAIQQEAVNDQQSRQELQHAESQPSVQEMISKLQQRLAYNPEDADGWLILGRSLKSLQRYAEAQTALINANRLMPNRPLILVELAEASLFASGQPEITSDIRQLLLDALAIEPMQQKGLWLLGMAHAQDGNHEPAIELWDKLRGQLDPASGVYQAVTQQIDLARINLGQVTAGIEIPITITIDSGLVSTLPETAILFVFVRPKGGTGMPLAVQRLSPSRFPLSLNISDSDLLRPGTSLGGYDELDISARISMTGIANALSGDMSAAIHTIDTGAITEIALHLDQRVP